MLKRSPKSKFATLGLSIFAIVLIYLALDSLLTLHSLANSYGDRRSYLASSMDISSGARIDSEKTIIKKLFERDAPKNALSIGSLKTNKFARKSLPKGIVITKEMVADAVSETIEEDNRIMFVPTNDKISPEIAERTDLLFVDSQGFGSQTVAHNAKILFDISNTSNDLTSHDTNPGYFVEIDAYEAQELTTALATGEVRFALLKKAD